MRVGATSTGSIISIDPAILDFYSTELQHNALPYMWFRKFAVKQQDLSKGKGDTIVFTRFADIERGGPLMEGRRLVGRSMRAAQYGVTVTEYGNAVEFSGKVTHLSAWPLVAEATTLLTRDLAMTTDEMFKDVVLGTPNVMFAGGRASRSALVGPSSGVTGDVMDIELVQDAVEFLRTSGAPKFALADRPSYVCIVHPHQTAAIMNDPSWRAADTYGNGARGLFTGELGRWNDVIFLDTNLMNNGVPGSEGYDADLNAAAEGGVAPANVYTGVIFGDNAYGYAEALPPELRMKNAEDYGREQGLAWYGIFGSDRINDDYVLRFETV